MKTKTILITLITMLAVTALIFQLCEKEPEEPSNQSPQIENLTSTPNTSSSNGLPGGEYVTVSVTATDPDKDNLSYSWEADGGNFDGQTNQSSVSWAAPMSTELEQYIITITVSDGAKTTSESIKIYVDKATPGINAIPKTFDFGASESEFQVKVFNTGEGQLKWETYHESTSWLDVNPTSGTVTTPNDTSIITLTIDRAGMNPNNYSEEFKFRNVDDNNNYISINVTMEVAETASINGYTYYSGTTIPVSGVLVSIGEGSSTTGTDGYYEISNILTGNHTLIATKDGYDNSSTNIEIGSGINNYNIEVTSALYTHNLFGNITNKLGDAVALVEVVVLNPDGTESNLKTTSSSSGYYQIPTVPQGERTITFTKETCEFFEISVFMANSNYELDIELLEYGLSCPGVPTVLYEGQIYNTVLIGDQCWFKENLNIGVMIDGNETMTDNEEIEKYCYGDNPSNCNTYGGLYQWNELMQYNTLPGTQGICPPGWHIPTDQEWKIMEGTVDSQYPVGSSEWNDIGYRGFDAGERLKSENGWSSNGNGSDLYGFNALPGGFRYSDGSFFLLGNNGYWWPSSEGSGTYAWSHYLYYTNGQVRRDNSVKTNGFSVRCLKD